MDRSKTKRRFCARRKVEEPETPENVDPRMESKEEIPAAKKGRKVEKTEAPVKVDHRTASKEGNPVAKKELDPGKTKRRYSSRRKVEKPDTPEKVDHKKESKAEIPAAKKGQKDEKTEPPEKVDCRKATKEEFPEAKKVNNQQAKRTCKRELKQADQVNNQQSKKRCKREVKPPDQESSNETSDSNSLPKEVNKDISNANKRRLGLKHDYISTHANDSGELKSVSESDSKDINKCKSGYKKDSLISRRNLFLSQNSNVDDCDENNCENTEPSVKAKDADFQFKPTSSSYNCKSRYNKDSQKSGRNLLRSHNSELEDSEGNGSETNEQSVKDKDADLHVKPSSSSSYNWKSRNIKDSLNSRHNLSNSENSNLEDSDENNAETSEQSVKAKDVEMHNKPTTSSSYKCKSQYKKDSLISNRNLFRFQNSDLEDSDENNAATTKQSVKAKDAELHIKPSTSSSYKCKSRYKKDSLISNRNFFRFQNSDLEDSDENNAETTKQSDKAKDAELHGKPSTSSSYKCKSRYKKDSLNSKRNLFRSQNSDSEDSDENNAETSEQSVKAKDAELHGKPSNSSSYECRSRYRKDSLNPKRNRFRSQDSDLDDSDENNAEMNKQSDKSKDANLHKKPSTSENDWDIQGVLEQAANEPEVFVDIDQIDEETGSNFIIKGKVISVGNLKEWSSPTKRGRIFKFDLKDKTGQIEVTAWNEVADDLSNIIDFNKNISLKNGTIKPAFNFKNHKYEITCNRNTSVQLITTNEIEVEKVDLHFTDFKTVLSLSPYDVVNVEGTVQRVYKSIEVESQRYNKSFVKKTVLLEDRNKNCLPIDLWNNSEDLLTEKDLCKKIRIINGKVNIYQGAVSVNATAAKIEK